MNQISEEFQQMSLDDRITGFIHSDEFDKHYTPKKHVENPTRTQEIDKTILNFLKDSSLNDRVEQITQFDECTIDQLKLVYSQDYIDFIEGMFDNVGEQVVTKDVQYILDTYICRQTPYAARQCVQSVLVGVDMVLQNKWKNGFCSVRPPGHHSGHKSRPNGFCIYNNVAIAAKYARQQYGIQKILILDWDVHHCDGTEDVFYNDPNTLVISLHRYDKGLFYPNSGDPEKVGGEQAQFKNVNIGWNSDEDDDDPGYNEYVYAYERIIDPIVKEFNPDFILISAGFDSAKGDPLGNLENPPLTYQYFTKKLIEINSKVLAVLEGGYNIKVTAECALATFKQLMGIPQEFKQGQKPNSIGLTAVQTTVDKHKEFWKYLSSPEILQYQTQMIGQTIDFISGGHQTSFQIIGNTIIKKTKQNELQFYQELDNKENQFYEENQRLKQFMPKVIEVNLKHSQITLENLVYKLEKASILDLKIGYKTYSPQGSAIKREKEIKKAKGCDQSIMGFRVAGAKIKNKDGQTIIDKNGSLAYKTITNHNQMKQIIESLFKSNEETQINQRALKDSINFIDSLINEIKVSKRIFRNTSILFIVDNTQKCHKIKWIDFNYVMNLKDDIENPNAEVDNNILGGLKYLLSMLQSLN